VQLGQAKAEQEAQEVQAKTHSLMELEIESGFGIVGIQTRSSGLI
jgi:hypothetical protein